MENKSEFIKLKVMPEEAVRSAYKNGYFVEAIQIAHAYLENQARSYLLLVGCVHFNTKQTDAWDITDTLPFLQIIKVLYILNQLSKEQYDNFKSLNTMRNKMIHQLFKDPYHGEYKGIPKSDYDKVYNETLDQIYYFSTKCEEIIEK